MSADGWDDRAERAEQMGWLAALNYELDHGRRAWLLWLLDACGQPTNPHAWRVDGRPLTDAEL